MSKTELMARVRLASGVSSPLTFGFAILYRIYGHVALASVFSVVCGLLLVLTVLLSIIADWENLK
jgi:hypothetical protein